MIAIRHRSTGATLYTSEAPTLREAVIEAVKARADLAGADLAGANLAGANLARADLADANLARADRTEEPRQPYRRATTPEERRVRDLERARRYRERHPEIPVVEHLDRRILDLVESGQGKLRMSDWHTCDTTHCRAGWAIALAGERGAELEDEIGPFRAGVAIYRASTGRVPHFFATNERALEDIRQCAAEDGAGLDAETRP